MGEKKGKVSGHFLVTGKIDESKRKVCRESREKS